MKQLSRNLRRSQTEAEILIWKHLRNRRLGGYKFRRQEIIGQYIVDFVCFDEKLIIELDGGQHANQVDVDSKRTEVLKSYGYIVLRFWNDDVFLNTGSVLSDIMRKLDSRSCI